MNLIKTWVIRLLSRFNVYIDFNSKNNKNPIISLECTHRLFLLIKTHRNYNFYISAKFLENSPWKNACSLQLIIALSFSLSTSQAPIQQHHQRDSLYYIPSSASSFPCV